MYIKIIFTIPILFYLQLFGSNIDISAWQKANINWQQFKGTSLSVLADAQPAFMALRPYLIYFEKLTGIKVNYHNVEQDKMRNIRKIDLTSKIGIYDVVPIGISHLGEAHQNGWLEPLKPYLKDKNLTDKEWFNFEDISSLSLELCQKDGILYSLPFDFSAPIFFYRKDIFKKYNIKVPDTYEDVVKMKIELQKKLDEDKLNMYAFATRTRIGAGLNTWTVIPAIRAYGGDMLNDKFEPIFDSKEAIKALEIYKDMVTGYGNPPNSKTLHFYEIRELFKQGKLASTILASHYFNEIDTPKKSLIWDKWDATLTPKGDFMRATSPWAWAFAINANSKNKKPAWLFLEWVTSKETAKLLKTGGAPARVSVWESDFYNYLNAPGLLKAVQWILKEADIDSMQKGLPEFPEVGLIASKAFSEIFYGANIAKTLNEAVIKTEAVMKNGVSRSKIEK